METALENNVTASRKIYQESKVPNGAIQFLATALVLGHLATRYGETAVRKHQEQVLKACNGRKS
jgi:hypothetical protein